MSMLSAQCDKLRAMAESVGLAMPQAATLMMEAVDTIWQLRDDLQRANAENARLRGKGDMYRDLVDCMVHPDIPDQLAAENRKLRELVRDMYEMAYPEYPSAFDAAFADRMRELGIEVTT